MPVDQGGQQGAIVNKEKGGRDTEPYDDNIIHNFKQNTI